MAEKSLGDQSTLPYLGDVAAGALKCPKAADQINEEVAENIAGLLAEEKAAHQLNEGVIGPALTKSFDT